jgi:hypothetical protein
MYHQRSGAGSREYVFIETNVDEDVESRLRSSLSNVPLDDIVMVGAPSAADIAAASARLGKGGVLNLAVERMPEDNVVLDIGRIHYGQILYIGGETPMGLSSASSNYRSNVRADLRPGGSALMVGAAGPMGQMHVQRAIMSDSPPRRIVVTDRHAERIERLIERFSETVSEREIELIAIDASAVTDAELEDRFSELGPFDDVVSMAPSPQIVAESLPLLAKDGVLNVFAGVAKGITAEVDLASLLRSNQRLIGTSGSRISDLALTLSLVESGKLSTDSSLAAIGGLNAFRAGLAAVKAGAIPGKIVIFPNISELPLTPLESTSSEFPAVYEKLAGEGRFWSKEAETELLARFL